MREVERVLSDQSPSASHVDLARNRIHSFLMAIDAAHIKDDDSSTSPDSISRADRHIYHAARQHSASVLTSDANLWLALRECGLSTILPLELIRRFNGYSLATTTFGILPTAKTGSIFVRAYPGSWASCQSGKYTAVNFPGLVWLYYDASKSSWVAEVAGLTESLECNVPIVANGLQTVCVSWDSSVSQPTIKLRVMGIGHPVSQPLTVLMPFSSCDNLTLGSYEGRDYFWNGSIYFCVINDRAISKNSWKSYLRHYELAPNPFDADRLKTAIARLV